MIYRLCPDVTVAGSYSRPMAPRVSVHTISVLSWLTPEHRRGCSCSACYVRQLRAQNRVPRKVLRRYRPDRRAA